MVDCKRTGCPLRDHTIPPIIAEWIEMLTSPHVVGLVRAAGRSKVDLKLYGNNGKAVMSPDIGAGDDGVEFKASGVEGGPQRKRN